MLEKTPLTTVPEPMDTLTKPLALVVGVWVSTYTAVPVAEPFKMLTFMPIAVLLTSASLALRTTAW